MDKIKINLPLLNNGGHYHNGYYFTEEAIKNAYKNIKDIPIINKISDDKLVQTENGIINVSDEKVVGIANSRTDENNNSYIEGVLFSNKYDDIYDKVARKQENQSMEICVENFELTVEDFDNENITEFNINSIDL